MCMYAHTHTHTHIFVELHQLILFQSQLGLSNLSAHPRKRLAAAAKSHQSSQTLCDPIDGSPPGSPVPGILQAGTLEWVAISFSNA